MRKPVTPGTAAIASRFRTAVADSIIITATRSPSGLSGQRSARRTYSAPDSPQGGRPRTAQTGRLGIR